MLIESLIVNGHLGSSSDGRILGCGSRFTLFTMNASILTGMTMAMDLDLHSTIQPSEFEARKLDHLQSLLLSINNQQRLNYDYGS